MHMYMIVLMVVVQKRGSYEMVRPWISRVVKILVVSSTSSRTNELDHMFDHKIPMHSRHTPMMEELPVCPSIVLGPMPSIWVSIQTMYSV